VNAYELSEKPLTICDMLIAARCDGPGLFSRAAYDRVLEVTSSLPANLARSLGLECVLGRDGNSLDFFILAKKENCETFFASSGFDRVTWRASEARLRAWTGFRALHNFCYLQSGLSDQILSLWLEFDASSGGEIGLIPSLFFGLRALAAETSIDIARSCLEIIDQTDPRRINLLAEVLNAGRSCLTVRSIGVMFSRPEKPLKLHLSVVEFCGLKSVLDCCGCGHAWGEIADWCAEFGNEDFGLLDLSLDLGDQISPRVGIEFTVYESPQSGAGRNKRFLEYVHKRGGCSAKERDAILEMAARDVPVFGPWSSTGIRPISHFKVTVSEDANPVFKVYPNVYLFRFDPSFELSLIRGCNQTEGCNNR